MQFCAGLPHNRSLGADSPARGDAVLAPTSQGADVGRHRGTGIRAVLASTTLIPSAARWMHGSVIAASILSLMSLASPSAAQAAGSGPDHRAQSILAERYSPVVRLVDSRGSGAPAEPYEPTSVDAVLGNPDVALRGPW